jgi:hypothetical protein
MVPGAGFEPAQYAEGMEFCFIADDPWAPAALTQRESRPPGDGGRAPMSNQTNISNIPPARHLSPKPVLDKSALRPIQVIERMNAAREGTKKRKIIPSWKFHRDH